MGVKSHKGPWPFSNEQEIVYEKKTESFISAQTNGVLIHTLATTLNGLFSVKWNNELRSEEIS